MRGDPISFAEVNARATMGLYEESDETFDPEGWIDREIANTYKIVELLGEGGMGAVFVAEHLRLRKQVAVKIIRPEIVDDEQIALRFRREALATARLEHPHVASAFDYDKLPEGGAYLVMQLVRGQSVRDLLNLQGRFEWQQACDIASQIADALSAAHAEGIVHRDLKPDNILLETRNGQYFVKVLDFGIARIVPEEAGRRARSGTEQQALTRVGMVVGTPGYMSPEQAMGETVDARADLYSLGVILWELIAGRPLWKASTLGEMFAKQFKENPPRLRDVLGGPVPGPLEGITAELLERAPEDRKLTAKDLTAAFKKLAMGLDPDAEVTGAYSTLSSGQQESRTRANKVLQPPTAEHEAWYNRSLQSLQETFEELENRHGRGRILIGVAAVALLVFFLIIAVCRVAGADAGDDSAARPDAAPTSAVEKADAEETKAEADAEEDAAGDAKPAADLEAEPAEDAAAAAENAEQALDPAVAAALEAVLHSDDRGERKKAAKQLLAHEPESAVPSYGRLVARMTDAKSCEGKKSVIKEIAAAGDARALPALEKLSAIRRSGCKPRGKGDCFGCLRRTLGGAIKGLKGEAADSA